MSKDITEIFCCEPYDEQQALLDMSSYDNTFGHNPLANVEAITGCPQKGIDRFAEMAEQCIRSMANAKEYMIDGRNEFAHEICARICADEPGRMDLYDGFHQIHRTLQQSLISDFLCFFDSEDERSAKIGWTKPIEELRTAYGRDWWRMPLI